MTKWNSPARRHLNFFLLPFTFFLAFASAGCGAIGVAVDRLAPRTVHAKYQGLAGQSVAVMVWADRAIKLEHDSVQSDLANALQNQLFASSAKELKGTTWPWPAESVVRYQLDHPGIESQPITQVAPRLGVSRPVTRLIYVEIERLSTRSDASSQLFRGNISANLKIVEIAGKDAKIGYEETGITAVFPPKSPPEGVLNSNDYDIYRGTVGMLAREIIHRLVSYEPD